MYTSLPKVDPDSINYSERYYDDLYEYRHVTLPKSYAKHLPTKRLLKEMEWRAMGIAQSRGWITYAIHPPEPYILLFMRPKDFQKLDENTQNEWLSKMEQTRQRFENFMNQKTDYVAETGSSSVSPSENQIIQLNSPSP